MEPGGGGRREAVAVAGQPAGGPEQTKLGEDEPLDIERPNKPQLGGAEKANKVLGRLEKLPLDQIRKSSPERAAAMAGTMRRIADLLDLGKADAPAE